MGPTLFLESVGLIETSHRDGRQRHQKEELKLSDTAKKTKPDTKPVEPRRKP
jgi:hypothetical protein